MATTTRNGDLKARIEGIAKEIRDRKQDARPSEINAAIKLERAVTLLTEAESIEEPKQAKPAAASAPVAEKK